MAATKIVLDSTDYKKSIFKWKNRIADNLSIAMLESMRLVATVSVGDFMKPHLISPGEYGRPGGERVIGKKQGGSKLGILTSRLKRSIMDEESEFGREGIRRVFIRSNVLVGEIGSTVPYARIHEFGGKAGRGLKSNIPARPYLRPAVIKATPRIEKIFALRMNLLIKKAF